MSEPLRHPVPIEDVMTADRWWTVIAAAGAAPSTHNTQPWRFRMREDAVELHLDPSRTLPAADPTGREARISCGAALFNLWVAMRSLGVEPQVSLLPHRVHPTLLAVVRPLGHRPAGPVELALHRAVPRRRSHRQPFHPAPVPQAALRAIVYAAGVEGGYLRLMTDPPDAGPVAELIRHADNEQLADGRYAAELARWTFAGGHRTDGVPDVASGPRPTPDDVLARRDFAAGRPRPVGRYESDPLLGVLTSAGDTPRDHLRSGQALQRALLTATDHGVGVSIFSSPVEVAATRLRLRDLVGTPMWPQLVLRFGSAVPTAAAPRRPVVDLVDDLPSPA